jgi:hypothetical protein
VQLELPEPDLSGALEDRQMRLVVLVVKPAACRSGIGESAQACPHSTGGQILDPAVVLVPSGVLTHLGNG